MSGLNNDGDEALDNVDSLISMIKGNKKNEAAQNSQDPDARPQTAPAGDSPASRIGDFDALRKKMNESKKEEPAPFVNEPSVPKRTGSPASQFDDLEFSDADDLQDKPPPSPRTPQMAFPHAYGTSPCRWLTVPNFRLVIAWKPAERSM